MNKYVVQVGNEYVASYSVWVLAMTEDIYEAVLYSYMMALEVANSVGGTVVEFKD